MRTCWAALAKAFPSDNANHASLLEEAKVQRNRLFPSGAMPEPTEAEAEADPEDGDMHEADMDEPADAEPTAAEYQSFFDSIMALP